MSEDKAVPSNIRRPKREEVKIDLGAYARAGETITARNTTDSIVVFVARIDGYDEICEFKARGDAEGNDYMELPSAFLKNAAFRKVLKQEIIEIVDAEDTEVLDAFQAQRDAWRHAQQVKEETDRMIQSNAPRAYSGIQCISQEGRGQCSEFAISSKSSERPPLCSKHAHLHHKYTPHETGTFTDGKPDVKWSLVSVYK